MNGVWANGRMGEWEICLFPICPFSHTPFIHPSVHLGKYMKLWPYILIAIGGATGALARYGLGGWVQGNRTHFPFGTLAVNVLGCLVMGVLMGLYTNDIAKTEHRLLIGISIP
jgi:hypothetical protein